MKTIILAGGRGTRLSEQTDVRPKPMVEIGGRPMLWHIMKIYAHYGHNEFVVALGYLGEVIKRYFLDYQRVTSDLSIDLRTGEARVHHRQREDWTVHLVDTGDETLTGGRIKRLKDWIGGETFMATYGDGVADVDLAQLVRFHRTHGKLATVTAVRPPARFGALQFDGDHVTVFAEKPQAGEGWINGGFFVLEPEVFDYIDGDQTHFEIEPLERLAAERQLCAYRHYGFWQSMDTLRDVMFLNHRWISGDAPWRVWDRR
ncbi:MAG TPA: glucose-1-phosphate cytidylyltransferase [Chloroflexota bacterium]|nr:glucose-1-phosphate cytidylyltransferase [Chloroflexota bacterium]